MRLRPPAVPLITVDPYFSIWSESNALTDVECTHWTGRPVTIKGDVTIDGNTFRFMGECEEGIPAAKQVSLDVEALTTTYIFEQSGVRLKAEFTTPLLPDDLYVMTRPVSYLMLSYEPTDGACHKLSVKLAVSEQICLDKAGQSPVFVKKLGNTVRMGTNRNPILGKDGDDLRIDWGYFYLTAPDAKVYGEKKNGMTYASAEFGFDDDNRALVTFAYDDIRSIEYFGEQLTSFWNKDGEKISDAIRKARRDYDIIMKRCKKFSDRMFIDAVKSGGEEYAELLMLAARQTIAAHKVAVDTDGDIIFISKECYSNGCAATVDVSYPSIPMFLLYNTELVKGMIRPIVKYARSDEWIYDFAPHDAGRYPRVNGQIYGRDANHAPNEPLLVYDKQMPVEECGNMIIMDAAVAVADKNADFAMSHKDLLDSWVKYLIENGRDPENQLCTDDFAGHLAHNCNLSLKAIVGIAAYGIILGVAGDKNAMDDYIGMAKKMAKDWAVRASNGDGSYKLAFDKPGTFSMKYNIVWDKLFGTEIMDPSVIESEVLSYKSKTHPYGLPLDSRQPYTKSDWLVWTATLAKDREVFKAMVEPLWRMFNYTTSRVPMTDWYYTLTGGAKYYGSALPDSDNKLFKCFRNRTVQGGLFIKLLEYSGKMRINNN